MNAAPFDTAASSYDSQFTEMPLARALRAIVWQRLDAAFQPGSRVLELACGTGEDARHLAGRGVHVLATDSSEAMLEVAREKCVALPVDFALLNLHELEVGRLNYGGDLGFDGVFSNFGGLNVLSDFHPLASFLAPLVRPGGRLIFVVMGRWCAWEILWHLAHLDPASALRRLRPATARVGAATLTVHYPPTTALRRAFAPTFDLVHTRPLGFFLPPSYLEPLTRQAWFPFRLFARLDRRLPFPLLGDHTLYEFVRQS